jgi:trk system potassium uptake protein TrkA
MFNIPRTIARVNNPRNAWLFNENFNVDVALNSANVLASLIREEMSMGDMMTLLKLRRGKYSLVEEKVPAGAKAIGIALKDMGLPKECVIAAVIRKGKITLPHGDFTFVEDDEVLAITDPLAAQQLSALLTPSDFRERGE